MKMRKISKLLFIFIFLCAMQSFGQNAIGLRLGQWGPDISFQTNKITPERIEADFGWSIVQNWYNWNFTGLYQWVRPIVNNFYWQAGGGLGVSGWYYQHDPQLVKEKEGIALYFILNGGAEYNFTEVPLQVSIDSRISPPLIPKGRFRIIDLGVSVRYKF